MGFFGLDIALLVGAFYLNTRAGRAYEVIDLTAQQLSVRRVDPWGHERLWKFQPQWLQVNARPAATAPYGLDRLEVRSHGRTLVIGKFLTPEERLQLSDSLRLALAQITTSSAVAPPVSNT